jgi:DNA invertase Pin-like site-specific DNA recombinase
MRAGILARQSKAKIKSIAEQTTACRSDAERQGWRVVDTYEDHVSASRFARKARDSYPRLVADITAEALDVVVCWAPDRADRELERWARFLTLCRTHHVLIRVTDYERTYDVADGHDWEAMARDGIGAQVYSEKLSRVVHRGLAGAAAEGRPHGVTIYGYRRLYHPETREYVAQEPDPDEAAVVREIFDRIKAGHSIRGVKRHLDDQGITTRAGNSWSMQSIRSTATKAAYAGRRTHNGETFTATWPAIVPSATYHAVQRILSNPQRRTSRSSRAVHWLSMIIRCDVCEGPVTAAKSTEGRWEYRCREHGHARVGKADLDKHVEEEILDYLSRPDVYEQLTAGPLDDPEADQLRDQLAEARVQLDELRAAVVARAVTVESMTVMEPQIRAEIKRFEVRLAELSAPPVLADIVVPGMDVRAHWKRVPLPARREVARLLCTPQYLGVLRLVRANGRRAIADRVRWVAEQGA